MIAKLTASIVLSGLALISSAEAMTFRFVPLQINNCTTECPKVIVAEGVMHFDDVGTFIETVRAGIARDKTIRPVVILSSVGGNTAAGLNLAQVFRQIKATVIVGRAVATGSGYTITSGGCASACVYALMGGVKRVVPNGSKLGVHWMSGPVPQVSSGSVFTPSADTKTDENADELYLRQFMRRMGIKPDLAGFIRKIPNSSLHVLTSQEIARFGIAQTKLR